MDFQFQKTSLKEWRKITKVLLGAVILLSVTQVLLVVFLFKKEQHWVLIPTFQTDERLKVSNKSWSKEYIVRWADTLLQGLLTVNASLAHSRMEDVLKLSTPSYYGTLQHRLKEEVREMKRQGFSTAFYPHAFKVFQKAQRVEVEGAFHTFYADDKKPVIQKKTWVLGWQQGQTGVILLNHCEEKTDG